MLAKRIAGYLVGVGAGTLINAIGDAWVTHMSVAPSGRPSIMFEIGIAIFFTIFAGFGAALLVIAPVWCLVILLRSLAPRFGALYFSTMGAALIFLAGCAMSSLAPKPLFIEDQTFFEGFRIAVERQGLVFLLAGAIFGFVYWTVSERMSPTYATHSA